MMGATREKKNLNCTVSSDQADSISGKIKHNVKNCTVRKTTGTVRERLRSG